MSKTVSTCICETNQIQNQPQENVFFHTLYRTQEDYPGEFLRTAKSTSPIQICAVFSCIGPDNLGAVMNIELNRQLAHIVAEAQSQPVLDYESFSNRVVNTLNVAVCKFIVARGGTPIKVSMTMIIIEGDTLRVLHIGNTKAVLIRDNKIMALTEEQTVAHRYVQMGAISAEDEKTHPENMNLTQYLGKMPQDGEVVPDKKVHLKLKDKDEICLMGLGISRAMPSGMRNVTLVKAIDPEAKARELIGAASNYGVKSGLTAIVLRIESTFLAPGDAVINNNPGENVRAVSVPGKPAPGAGKNTDTDPSDTVVNRKLVKKDPFGAELFDDSGDKTTTFNRGDLQGRKLHDEIPELQKKNEEKKKKKWNILIPIILFFSFALVGFGGTYVFLRMNGMMGGKSVASEVATAPSIETGESVFEEYQMFAATLTIVYPEPDENCALSDIVETVEQGDFLTIIADDNNDFYKVRTQAGNEGYVIKAQLVATEPEVTESVTPTPTPSPSPTPVPEDHHEVQPETSQTTQATEPPQTVEPAETSASETSATSETSASETSESSADTSETPASSSESSETPADTTPAASDPADTPTSEPAPGEQQEQQ